MRKTFLLSKKAIIINIITQVKNLFFRKNNLLVAYMKAYRHNNHIVIGRSSNLFNCKINIVGGGNYVTIGEKCNLKGLSIYMNDNNNTVQIGNRVNVNSDSLRLTRFNACGGSQIIIGDNCLFSNSIELHTTDYHPIYALNDVKQIPIGPRTNIPSPIVIGEHTWIGLRTIVLRGVVIKPNTIIGACSVVVKSNQESYEVIAGNPAKVIKRGTIWSVSNHISQY